MEQKKEIHSNQQQDQQHQQDLLNVQLSNDYDNNYLLLNNAFINVQKNIEKRSMNQDLAMNQLDQLKVLIDQDYQRHNNRTQSQLTTLNQLRSNIQMLQKEIQQDLSRKSQNNDFQQNQNSILQNHKININSNYQTDTELKFINNQSNNKQNNMNQNTYSHLTQKSQNKNEVQLNNINNYIDEQSDTQSMTCIQYEEISINLPKSIRIKQNSFNTFKIQTKGLSSNSNENQIIQQQSNLNEQIQNGLNNLDDNINQKQPQNIFYGQQQELSGQNNLGQLNSNLKNQELKSKDSKLNNINENEGQNQQNIETQQKQELQDNVTVEQQKQENVNEIKHILEDNFKRIQQLFDDKYIDDLEIERIKFIEKIQSYKSQSYLQNNQEFKTMIDNFENHIHEDLQYYQNLYNQMMLCSNLINEKEGWKSEKNKDGMQVQYKKIPNSKLIALRLECDNMNMDIKVLLSIIYEIDLYSEWFPFCKVGKNLKTVDKACKVVYLKMDVPVISNREVYIHGIGANRLKKDGTLMIMARTIDKDLECQKETGIEIPKQSKCVRVDIPFFTFIIKPISPKQLCLYSVSNLDAHIKFVPDSLINLVTRKFAYYLFEKMLEQNKKFKGSKWEQNMKNSPEFYEWIEKEYNEFFEKQSSKVS